MADTDMWEAERERFEAEIRKVNDDPAMLERWPGGAYKHHGVDGRWGGWKMACRASRPAEVDDEGQSDAKRLMFAMQDFDGFVGVKEDKYDLAIVVMEERGLDEPDLECEIEGVRRLIDMAMAAPSHTTNKGK